MKKIKLFLTLFSLLSLCVSGCNLNKEVESPSKKDNQSSEVHNISSEDVHSSVNESKSSVNPVSSSSQTGSSSSSNSSSNSSASSVHTHSWGNWEPVKAANCTEAGSEKRTCDGCGQSETRATNALGHDFGNWTTIAATCTEAGSQKRTCARCGKEETNVINALGHNWNNGVVTTPATETSTGVRTYTCERCKVTKTETIPVINTHNQIPEEPEITLTDVESANMQINFNNVTDNCMVSPKVKAYVDAMEAQEKTLDKPYHFSSLYGPDDYAKLAAASDKGDGASYADADKGGVDVCSMLSRNDYSNTAENYPIKLNWNNNGNTFNSAKLKFWSTEDQSDLREVSLGANATSASLANLYRARKYRAQLVTDDGKASQGFEFSTGDYPRTITMGGIKNVRDIGGYMTSYGVRTNQGLIYRGYYIDDKSGGHGINYNAEAGKVNDEVMKIGYEIDLQKSSEINGRSTSCLNGADYKCLTLVAYDSFLKQDSYKNLPEVMHIIANSDVKHSYFHCWGGADRTGMLAFFINAICGVSYTDLIEDFEITTETNNKRCHMHNSNNAHFPKFLNEFMNNWSGFDTNKTINDNCEKWLLEVAGVSAADILKIRQIMIPGYTDGMEQFYVPQYTPSQDWITDGLAHWKTATEDINVKCVWGRHKGGECSVCGYSGSSSSGDSGNDTDFTQVLTRVWSVTSNLTNSDGKQYQQIKDNEKNKVGVRILQCDISSSSSTTFESDGKLPKDGSSVTYHIKAPKAGTYQMIMNGRVSDAQYKLGNRGITVTINGSSVAIDGDNRDGGLNGAGDNDFVICPSITLTGNEDVITVACRYYRISFNQSAYLVFSEH